MKPEYEFITIEKRKLEIKYWKERQDDLSIRDKLTYNKLISELHFHLDFSVLIN